MAIVPVFYGVVKEAIGFEVVALLAFVHGNKDLGRKCWG
jgi:hypothetical protein